MSDTAAAAAPTLAPPDLPETFTIGGRQLPRIDKRNNADWAHWLAHFRNDQDYDTTLHVIRSVWGPSDVRWSVELEYMPPGAHVEVLKETGSESGPVIAAFEARLAAAKAIFAPPRRPRRRGAR